MNILKGILENGIHSDQERSEKRLIRAVNFLSLNAIVMVLFAGIFGVIVQENASSKYILFSIPLFLLTLYLNARGKTMLALTLIFLSSAILISFYSFRTGEESYTHSHFILNIIGLSMLFGEGRTRFYLVANLAITLILLIFVFVSFHFGWFDYLLDEMIDPVPQRKLNLLVLIICCIVFSIVVVVTNASQKKALSVALEEQKVLLAEVNHRVKNNLAVIVSLIKLRRDQLSDVQAQEVLTEFYDQVMSMALIHRKMYEEKNMSAIDVSAYVRDLLAELKNSYAVSKDVDFKTEIGSVTMDVSKGVPFGLILNELITNSMKHAFPETVKHPEIRVSLATLDGKRVRFLYADNGIGTKITERDTTEKLGISLISSLCDQLDADYRFFEQEGFCFEMTFRASTALS